MNNILKVSQKEFASFFSSPIAYIFLAAFLAVNLFIFFWVETFFARNIADVRPLFEWMPMLLILLVAAITMRMWSEERRAGTLEFLLSMPVKSLQLVLGKFLACLGLVFVALLLTLPLPITVSLFGPLDWGPVFGGYLATLFLAAAYVAIGLFISARSVNQIISLIVTVAVCGFFYLLGSESLTSLFGNQISELLKLLGSGSRFDAITRGVIDLRDLYYYLSLVGVFLTLNVFTLEWLRWQGNRSNAQHRLWGLVTGLFVANFLTANLWLSPVGYVRADLTDGNLYSISEATRSYLKQLQEPLLIRGYFSSKTHPLLAPLVPRLRDLMKEYAAAGEGRVRVEFIDPQTDPELEREANEKYGIKPVPFQFASKYQASVVNSYFNILVEYGDQHEVLGFRDLIDVKVQGETDLDVELRNPEYDLTQSLKKVLYSYQGEGTLFANISHPLSFKGYISADEKLPDVLVDLKHDLQQILNSLNSNAGDKLSTQILDPDAKDGALAKELETNYGFRPMSTNLFDSHSFWFYMTLEGNGQIVQIELPENFEKAELERSIKAALKRFSSGFLKTLALNTPVSPAPQFGMGGGSAFSQLRDTLAEEHNIVTDDLSSGQVNAQADLLLLASPKNLDDKQLFAVDQFLMRGGTVVVSTSPFDIQTSGALSAQKNKSGLAPWLKHHGISLEESMVLDSQNSAFPIPVNRRIAGFVVRETQLVDYPYFPDIRKAGLDKESGMLAGIDQVTMTWPSPIILDEQKNKQRRVIRLLQSSDQSWKSESLDIQPDYATYGKLGFPTGSKREQNLLGVAVEGRFVLLASNNFLSDQMLNLATSAMGTQYQKPIQLVENIIDWSLEDRGLLSLRGRAQFSRALDPMERETQIFWEYLNYGLAIFGLLMVWIIHHQVKRAARSRYAILLDGL
ncbi:MAG: Gldg family protein [Candidatus Thiodiazotropha sp.]